MRVPKDGNIDSGFNAATDSGGAVTVNVNYAIHW